MKRKVNKTFKNDTQNFADNVNKTSNILKKRSIPNSLDSEIKSANTDIFNSYDISKNDFDKIFSNKDYMNDKKESIVSYNRFDDRENSNNNIFFTRKNIEKSIQNNKIEFEPKNTNNYTNLYKYFDMPKIRFGNTKYLNKYIHYTNIRDSTSVTNKNKYKSTNKRQYNVQDKNEYVINKNNFYNTFTDEFDKTKNKIEFKTNSKVNKRQFKYKKEKESQSVSEAHKGNLEDRQNIDFREYGYKNTFKNKENKSEDKVNHIVFDTISYKKNKSSRCLKEFSKISRVNEETKSHKINKKLSNIEKDNSRVKVQNEVDRDFSKKTKSTDDLAYTTKKISENNNIRRKKYKLKSFNEAKEVKFNKNSNKVNRRKNYKESGFTREKTKKDDKYTDEGTKKSELNDGKNNKQNKNSFQKDEKNKEKLQNKKEKLEKNINKTKNKKKSKGTIYAISAVNSYLETGKDDNAGVGATHKLTDTVDTLARKRYFKKNKKALKQQKKLSKINTKIEKKERKIFFKTNIEDLKKNAEYQKSSKYKKFLKRKQYKKSIYRKYKERLSDKIKKSFTAGSKKLLEYIKSKTRKVVFLLFVSIGIFFMFYQIASVMINMVGATVSNTASTSYLSNESILQNINQEFSFLEQGLQEEMENVEENHPGYDEYIVKGKEKIGHDVHQLLSYITARYGVVKDISEIESELNNLYNKMYTLTYKVEIEIRYKTVHYSYTDSDGHSHKGSYKVPYEYKKLIVTLEKKELDDIVKEEFENYPNNLSHYETLVASKGNMELIFGSGSEDTSEIIDNPKFLNPGIEFNEESVKAIVKEAEKHIGKRYVFGANGPNNFDCSSFVCWTYTHSEIKDMPRTTAWGIYKNYCTPISPSEAKAGDIIFFKNTYNSGSPISHVGIYVGNGYMIHAGDPIKYSKIDTPYWRNHFYGFGRPR